MAQQRARTQIRRLPDRQVMDRAAMQAVLLAGRLAHIGVADAQGEPRVLPIAYGVADDQILFHGSSASALFKSMAAGAPVCITVTHVDGLVVARAAFEASMNYRSVMVYGVGEVVPESQKMSALERISEHLFPHRWQEFRKPTAQELKATLVIQVPLTEWSLKVREGGPDDSDADCQMDIWAGHIPMRTIFETPVNDHRVTSAAPSYLEYWRP